MEMRVPPPDLDTVIAQRLNLHELGDQLQELCRRCRVKRLDLFGSAVTGRFESGRSDLDVLVEFEAMAPADYAKAYFDLREGLIGLFDRPIDLLTPAGLKNPYLRNRVESERRLIYAA